MLGLYIMAFFDCSLHLAVTLLWAYVALDQPLRRYLIFFDNIDICSVFKNGHL